MIVGFTITDFKGNQEAAVKYIEKVCILDSPDIARNIVNAGVGVNVYSKAIDVDDLNSQPFESSVIETIDGKYLVASIVNFNLELTINDKIIRLLPTEYVYIDYEDIYQVSLPIRQGLVKVFPDNSDEWILSSGVWDDDSVWVDSNTWKDE